MKVLTLLASPRPKGISASIAQRFTDTAAALGADIDTISLDRLTFRGCRGCYACKGKSQRCILLDELTPVLAAVEAADILVLATPVYFGDVTAPMKAFLDRCYAFLAPTYMSGGPRGRFSGKKLVFISTQGHPDPEFFGDIFPRVSGFLEWMGFDEARLVRTCGVGPGRSEAAQEEVLAAAELAARELLQTQA